MFSKKTIEDVDVAGKKVLVRVDFNVPIADGTVTDDTRIQAALPTIRYLVQEGAKVILMSHLGRPAGTGFEEKYSLVPVGRVLGRILGQDVKVIPDLAGEAAHAAVEAMQPGQVIILENTRFDKREKKNDEALSRDLASLGDLYVNDAFGTAHRAHASTAGIASFLPAVSGYLLAREVETLGDMLASPQRPFVAILGGSKVSDKIAVIDHLLDIVDVLIIGGGMCFTFLAAQGLETGKSLMEADWIERAKEMMDKAKKNGVQLLLPIDVVAADRFAPDADSIICAADEIPADRMGLDIGPSTCLLYGQAIAKAKTIFWNGPMGVFEMEAFENGTKQVALAVARNKGAQSIIGGGDSVAAIKKFDLADQVTFVSTGGGASMELVEGKVLPGVAALDDKE
ncbi:MAG: phosphoglycerate kinase [Coriobacteriales bacterium]|nr:phosphoglycerate kinase [Coriobacteriales bacterium]